MKAGDRVAVALKGSFGAIIVHGTILSVDVVGAGQAEVLLDGGTARMKTFATSDLVMA